MTDRATQHRKFLADFNPHAVMPVTDMQVVLERLRVSFGANLGAAFLQSMEVIQRARVELLGGMAFELAAHVLAEQLPPETVTRQATVTGSRTVEWVVAATWWDHFKLQYAQRWWARWYVRRRPAAVVPKQETVRIVRDVKLTLDLRRYRTYPGANRVLPPDTWGNPVRAYAMQHRWEGVDS